MTDSLKQLLKSTLNLIGLDIKRVPSYAGDSLLYTQSESENRKFVNIGAGGFYHPQWINLDIDNDYYRKLQSKTSFVPYDLTQMKPIPFDSDSVDIFYTSHTIEHLNNECVKYLFDEVYRCLKPNGVFRVTCPDMEIQHRAYSRNDFSFWPQPSPWNTKFESLEDRFLEHFATVLVGYHQSNDISRKLPSVSQSEFKKLFKSLSLSEFFDELSKKLPENANAVYPQGHINWFTYPKVELLLKNSGFKNVYRSGFGQSAEAKLRRTDIFDSTCPELSLYAESIK